MALAVDALLRDEGAWTQLSERCHTFARTRADESSRVQVYTESLRRLGARPGMALGHTEEAVERG